MHLTVVEATDLMVIVAVADSKTMPRIYCISLGEFSGIKYHQRVLLGNPISCNLMDLRLRMTVFN